MGNKGQKLHLLAFSVQRDQYGVARMRVPYRPKGDYADGLDCHGADDVFTLFWKYTTPQRMGYTSSATRVLNAHADHSAKLRWELVHHKITHVLVRKEQMKNPLVVQLLKDARALGLVTVVDEAPLRGSPMGVDVNNTPAYVVDAWRMINNWLRKQTWPMVGLEVWSAVGAGVAQSAGKKAKATQERPTRDRVTEEELERIRMGEEPEVVLGEIRINKQSRLQVAEAREEALVRKGREVLKQQAAQRKAQTDKDTVNKIRNAGSRARDRGVY